MKQHLQKGKIWLVGLLGAGLLKLLNSTLRWQNLGLLVEGAVWKDPGPKIFAFWHGKQLMMSFAKTDFDTVNPIAAIISGHQDGRMIAAAMKRLRIDSVEGSSTRGGVEALKGLIDRVKRQHVAVTPDGPRGPIYKSKPGVIFLASRTGVKIYPLAYAAEKYWKFSSWDEMVLPKPFSRAVRTCGEGFEVPKALKKEDVLRYQAMLDEVVNRAQQTVDSYEFS